MCSLCTITADRIRCFPAGECISPFTEGYTRISLNCIFWTQIWVPSSHNDTRRKRLEYRMTSCPVFRVQVGWAKNRNPCESGRIPVSASLTERERGSSCQVGTTLSHDGRRPPDHSFHGRRSGSGSVIVSPYPRRDPADPSVNGLRRASVPAPQTAGDYRTQIYPYAIFRSVRGTIFYGIKKPEKIGLRQNLQYRTGFLYCFLYIPTPSDMSQKPELCGEDFSFTSNAPYQGMEGVGKNV